MSTTHARTAEIRPPPCIFRESTAGRGHFWANGAAARGSFSLNRRQIYVAARGGARQHLTFSLTDIREDIELRQMLGRAEERMSRERAAALVKQATECLDARLLAAASPHINSHYGLLPGSHGRSERAKSRKWAGALAYVIQTASSVLAAILLRYFDP